MTRKTLLMMTVAALMPLATSALTGCAPQVSQGKAADLSFSQMAPLQLNIGSLAVINNTQHTENARVQPGLALERYAHKRLQAVGGDGTLNFIIQQASLKSMDVQPSGQWTEAFQLSKPIEYTVTMRVGLDLVNRKSGPNVHSAFTLERKKELPGGVSLADRDRQLNVLIESMIKDVDTAVERGLVDNMKVVVRPGAITFGKPTPLESGGSMVVQPGSAGSNPVVIQGTMD